MYVAGARLERLDLFPASVKVLQIDLGFLLTFVILVIADHTHHPDIGVHDADVAGVHPVHLAELVNLATDLGKRCHQSTDCVVFPDLFRDDEQQYPTAEHRTEEKESDSYGERKILIVHAFHQMGTP